MGLNLVDERYGIKFTTFILECAVFQVFTYANFKQNNIPLHLENISFHKNRS